jgi:hypothetical protein
MRALPLLGSGLAASVAGLALAAPVSFATFADQIDAIGLARAADALGDAELERALGQTSDREAALVAARAALFAEAPERLVPKLVGLACGRDPALAPEAALTLYTLAERVNAESFATREVLLSDVKQAIQSLETGCSQDPRPDIAIAIETLRAKLLGMQ